MNKSPVIPILIGVLVVSALCTVGLTFLHTRYSREVRNLQGQATFVNNTRAVMNALANDTLEYSKKNPAIDPILVSVGLKPGAAGGSPAATPSPASR